MLFFFALRHEVPEGHEGIFFLVNLSALCGFVRDSFLFALRHEVLEGARSSFFLVNLSALGGFVRDSFLFHTKIRSTRRGTKGFSSW
jgi:hypothetical protein